jgi:hypothetical protein
VRVPHRSQTAVGGGYPSIIEELVHFAAEEWSTLPERCSKLIDGYKKNLLAVILVKGCASTYWLRGANHFIHSIFYFILFIVNSSFQNIIVSAMLKIYPITRSRDQNFV